MNAPASAAVRPRTAGSGKRRRERTAASLAAVLTLAAATAARAQLAAQALLVSDYRYRGVSLSEAKPAVSVDLSYDYSGGYVGGTVIGGNAPGAGVGVIGSVVYAGYAHRIGSGLTLDAGVSHANFSQYFASADLEGQSHRTDTEAYAGLRATNVSAYLHYSPRYFGDGAPTLYAEVNPALPLNRRLRLFGHLGLLSPLERTGYSPPRERFDLRAGLAAQLGRGEVQVAWTSARPPVAQAYGGRDALVVAASWSF